MRVQKGQSLLEVVMAMGVVSLVLVALVNIVIASIYNSTYAKQQAVATRYASEGLEWLRKERDVNWSTFYTKAAIAHYCIDTLDWLDFKLTFDENASYPCGTDANDFISGTDYTRWVVFSRPNANTVTATVKVKWIDSRGDHVSQAGGEFTDWRTR